jgi:hypothetical protein
MNNIIKGKIAEGFLALVENTKRKSRSANKWYVCATIQWEPGGEDMLYFTEYQIEVAKKRGMKMSELVPGKQRNIFGLRTGYSIFGHAVAVKNTIKRRWKQPDFYVFIKMIDTDDKTGDYCFTPNDITVAMKRGAACNGISRKSAFVDVMEDIINRFDRN